MSAAGTTGTSTANDALEALARALDSALYAMTLQGARLTITNRRAAVLTESVYVESGWFWWGWGERLVPVENVDGATEKITFVLRDNRSM